METLKTCIHSMFIFICFILFYITVFTDPSGLGKRPVLMFTSRHMVYKLVNFISFDYLYKYTHIYKYYVYICGYILDANAYTKVLLFYTYIDFQSFCIFSLLELITNGILSVISRDPSKDLIPSPVTSS